MIDLSLPFNVTLFLVDHFILFLLGGRQVSDGGEKSATKEKRCPTLSGSNMAANLVILVWFLCLINTFADYPRLFHEILAIDD